MVGEVVAATAYVELCLRTVTEPELRRVFLAFLLMSPNSPPVDPPLITILISRLHSPNMVSGGCSVSFIILFSVFLIATVIRTNN